MKLVTLTSEEFESFASNHEQSTFLQSISWTKVKGENGWKHTFLGFKDDSEIVAVKTISILIYHGTNNGGLVNVEDITYSVEEGLLLGLNDPSFIINEEYRAGQGAPRNKEEMTLSNLKELIGVSEDYEKFIRGEWNGRRNGYTQKYIGWWRGRQN